MQLVTVVPSQPLPSVTFIEGSELAGLGEGGWRLLSSDFSPTLLNLYPCYTVYQERAGLLKPWAYLG